MTTPKITGRRPLSERIESSVGAFLAICGVIILTLTFAFLAHENRTATAGYQLKILHDEYAALLQKNEVLSMKISDLQSLRALENDTVLKNMVKITKPKYIRGDTAVAKK